MKPGSVWPVFIAAAVAGCSGIQSALDPQGAPAIQIGNLITGIVATCAAIWILVVVMLGWALLRRSRKDDASRERPLTVAVSVSVASTIAIVAGLTIASFVTTRSIGLAEKAPLTIAVVGQQWWWQVVYVGADPASSFQTANEIHIPIGQDVRIKLDSPDVIHSFWVPSLAGKQDLVPGRTNNLLLRAERAGVYRGQCAEFCGLQHSHMAVMVIAEPPADFERWAVLQRADGLAPTTPEAAAGKAAFLAKPCAACHTVRGTPAAGTIGPDLTHVGSRRTIAAGLLETTRGSLAAWTADPQTLKPGNNMPNVPLTSLELRNISAYLDSLK